MLAGADRFGIQPANGDKVIVEFVSANPTGPLHVGHASQAALGSTVCNLLASQGWTVQREFYYNDAGVQIGTLAHSTQLRIKGFKPGDDCWPVDPANPESKKFYNGEYIADIAADFLAKKTVKADDREFTASGDPDDLDSIRQFAVAYLRHEQDLDLQAFGVHFDNYFLETSLYTNDSGRDHGGQAGALGQDLRARQRAVAAHDRVRRRQGPRHAQVRRHVHLLRARRRLPPGQVGTRLQEGHQRAGQRPPRHRSPACAPACRRPPKGCPRAGPTTCCTR